MNPHTLGTNTFTVMNQTIDRALSKPDSTEHLKGNQSFTTAATMLLLLLGSNVYAKGEVAEIYTQETRGSLRTYFANDELYQWGVGRNLLITGFSFQGRDYDYRQAANRVEIKRVDNPNSSGNRCSVFVEKAESSQTYAPSYPDDGSNTGSCDLSRIISGRILNSGALDLFSNAGYNPRTFKNIERVDFISDAGIDAGSTAQALTDAGHVVIEKSGNNEIKIAAILSLDADGEPASYGPMVLVNSLSSPDASAIRYGETNIELDLDFLSNEDSADPGYMTYIESFREHLGMAFISREDLGITLDQTYYGFSLFAPDVDAAIHDLTDPSTFPLDTIADELGPGDADVFAGSAFPSDPINGAPVAVDDDASAPINTAISINVTENDLDPDNDPLVVTPQRQPDNGVISLNGNEVIYTPNAGFQGSDSFTYMIDDGRGAFDTATVRIVVTDMNLAPDAVDDAYDLAAGTSREMDILANDSDPENNPLEITILSSPIHGQLSFNSNLVSYTPDADYSGKDQFIYQIDDGQGGTDVATVRISIGAVLADTEGQIETGLTGHGAGSMGGSLALLLGLAARARASRRYKH